VGALGDQAQRRIELMGKILNSAAALPTGWPAGAKYHGHELLDERISRLLVNLDRC
jgi:hypothetical protein